MEPIFLIAILIMSVVLHEVSHGYVADLLGDPTARLAGRLTLNPIKHLDWIGSVIVPGLLILLGGFVFGWAKPVPYNPHQLRGGKWGPAIVAAAGPGANFLIALVFAIVLRSGAVLPLSAAALSLVSLIVLLNLMLAVFNLIPVAPLDGSRLLFTLIPYRYHRVEEWLERHQLFVLIFLIILLVNTTLIESIVYALFHLFTGQ